MLAPGTVFAGHRIEAVAGQGGMGTVYRATHLALDHVVALKVIAPSLASDEAFRERFRSESRIAASLRHPHVVRVHHAGEEEGLLFVTMDLIDGPDLRALISGKGVLEPDEAVSILEQIAAALDEAHSRGLVHRDVKPANVLVELRAGADHAYLTDFGLTKRADAATIAGGGLTTTGAFVGTLDYVAPEQIQAAGLDARTDVYALGCLFQEMLSGAPPFADRGENIAKIYAHLSDPPPPLPPELDSPAGLGEAIGRALAKEPDERFPSAGDFARAARAALDGAAVAERERSVAVGAAAPTTEAETSRIAAEPPAAAAPKWRWPAAGAAALAALVAAFLALSGDEERPGDSRRGAGIAAEIPVEGLPVGIAAAGDQVFVVTRQAGTVERVDGGSAVEIGAIGGRPEELVAVGDDLWVTNSGEDTVEVVATDGISRLPLPAGDEPRGIAAGEGRVFVTNALGGTVTSFDAADPNADALTRSIEPALEPHGIVVGGGSVWVSARESGELLELDPVDLSLRDSIRLPAGANPKGVLFDDGRVWVANTDDDSVSVVEGGNTRTVENVCDFPKAFAAAFGAIWLSCGEGAVLRLDPATADLRERVEVPGVAAPQLEDIAASSESLWLSTGAAGTVVEIDPGG